MQEEFQTSMKTPMSAKRLVLLLFGALDEEIVPISRLIVGASVFNIEESAVRMAANRLVNDGVLTLIERGSYRVGEKGQTLYQASRTWQRQEDRLKAWAGDWVCVHVSHLGRSDRKELRSRLRALSLCGFAELEQGLWIRPNNLSLSTQELAMELTELGLDRRAVVLQTANLIHYRAATISELWDSTALEASYRSALALMTKSRQSLHSKPPNSAAKEVLEIGSSVAGALTRDPLLPEALVDAALRRRLYDAMLDYDALGKSIWSNLFKEDSEGDRLPDSLASVAKSSV